MSTLENMGQRFFLTYNDMSKGTGEQFLLDLTVEEKSVCVVDPTFFFHGDSKYV